MSITIIKENDSFHILDAEGEFEVGKPVDFAEAELLQIQKERAFWLDLQMPSFSRGDEDESAEELF